MKMNKTGISSDCVCDLAPEYLSENHVDIIYFYLTTERGRFRDVDEISSSNVIEYFEKGGDKILTNAPPVNEYVEFFSKNLEQYEEVIHITITSGVSKSYMRAVEAKKQMGELGERVYVVDSQHLSTGMGHMVMKAVEMRDMESSAEEIFRELMVMRQHISTSFIVRNADYLYRNGRVSKKVQWFCRIFNIHPVIALKKGEFALKYVGFGNMDSAAKRYIRKELKRNFQIDKKRLFVTHVGCCLKNLEMIKEEVAKNSNFDEVIVTTASATVSSNCGTDTFGLLYVYDY